MSICTKQPDGPFSARIDFGKGETSITERIPHAPTGWSSDYYELPEGATELQDLIEFREMNFSLGNIFKACYRLGHKNGTDRLYDLRKMKWFIEREIRRIEGESK